MRALTFAIALLALTGCRDPLGTPDYSDSPDRTEDAGMRPERLLGSDPYIPGQRRLNIGLFYEGDASQRFGLDAERLCLREPHTQPLRCYFIFAMPDGQLQYDQDTVDDRIEGVLSDRITLTGTPFWGGGVVWDAPTDLSAWTTLHLALKSSDPSFAEINISMQSGTDMVIAPVQPAANYGWVNDGEWHTLDIPLADFPNLDRQNIRSPLILGGTGSTADDELLVDEVYLTQD